MKENRFSKGEKVALVGKWRLKGDSIDGTYEVIAVNATFIGAYTYDLFYINSQGHYLKLEKVPENSIIKKGDYLS